MAFTIEVEREKDKRWIAEVTNLPGVMAYGTSRKEAVAKAQALAHCVLADRLKPSEKAQKSAENAGLSKILRPAKTRSAGGFRVGTVQEFLGLSDKEMAFIDLKGRLVALLKATREAKGITQQKLAKLMASSQSRVAKLEGACADASLDLIFHALFAVGLTTQEISRRIASKNAAS